MSIVSVAFVGATALTLFHDAPPSLLTPPCCVRRGWERAHTTGSKFVAIVSPPFGDTTRTIGGLRPRSHTIVLFRMSVRCGFPQNWRLFRSHRASKLIPVNSNQFVTRRLGAPHQTHPGDADPLFAGESHFVPSLGGTPPEFVCHTTVVVPPAGSVFTSSAAPPVRCGKYGTPAGWTPLIG